VEEEPGRSYPDVSARRRMSWYRSRMLRSSSKMPPPERSWASSLRTLASNMRRTLAGISRLRAMLLGSTALSRKDDVCSAAIGGHLSGSSHRPMPERG
jgi:hypothetical protein